MSAIGNEEILNYSEILNDELRTPGSWLVASVEPSIAWPIRPQKIIYLGQEYWIIPITNDAYPGVAIHENFSPSAQEKILRFLSVLSWVEEGGISVFGWMGGGNVIRTIMRDKKSGFHICDKLRVNYLPEVTSPKAQLALALMREERSLIRESTYAFLSFYRVLEVAVGGKDKSIPWINEAIESLNGHKVDKAFDTLNAAGIENIAEHLYYSGRCAVAHATGSDIIDPDDPRSTKRLNDGLPVIEALAERAIEEVLGIKARMTVFKEHLYELAGFKKILGENLIRELLAGTRMLYGGITACPAIDFQIQGQKRFEVFQNLFPICIEPRNGKIMMQFERKDGRAGVQFYLNFEEERLEFDIHNDMSCAQDGSAIHALHMAQITEFTKWYYMNGCLNIINSKTGELISRKDPFIPVNVMVNPEGFDKDIADWQRIADERLRLDRSQ